MISAELFGSPKDGTITTKGHYIIYFLPSFFTCVYKDFRLGFKLILYLVDNPRFYEYVGVGVGFLHMSEISIEVLLDRLFMRLYVNHDVPFIQLAIQLRSIRG